MANKKKAKAGEYEGTTTGYQDSKFRTLKVGPRDKDWHKEAVKRLKKKRSSAGSKTKVAKSSDYDDKNRSGVKFDDMHPDVQKAHIMERPANRHSRNLKKKKK